MASAKEPEYRDEPKTSHQRLLDIILTNNIFTQTSICELLCILISVVQVMAYEKELLANY